MTDQERHDMFATSLALILPAEVLQEYRPGVNLTHEVLHGARRGAYARCGWSGSWPYYFTADIYCGHLLPVVKDIWRACYVDVGLAHTNDNFTALLDAGKPTENHHETQDLL
jgi:hypothetical protein